MKYLLLISALLSVPVLVSANEPGKDIPVTRTLVWPDGTRYVGGVLHGKRSGKGTIFWQDGTRFIGLFENDLRNGPGTLILPDGTVYTGFFDNDELLDSHTNQSIKLGDQAFIEAETKAALGNTNLPIEADSLFLSPSAETSKSSEQDESTRVASAEPGLVRDETPKETSDISNNSLQNSLETIDKDRLLKKSVTSVTENVKQELIKVIDLWGAAWSDQNVTQYLSNYSKDFMVPRKKSREAWQKMRKERLTKPEYIILKINYQNFQPLDNNVVEVFFKQTYKSNTYNDIADKVLRMRKEGPDWKILRERSR